MIRRIAALFCAIALLFSLSPVRAESSEEPARLRLVAAVFPAYDFARVIGLHTYSQSPRRDYDITLTGGWVERGGFRFEEFVLTPRREDGNDGRTE